MLSSLQRSPSPIPPAPSAVHWQDSSHLAQETIERNVHAHAQHQDRQLSGASDKVPRLVDLVANRLATADTKTVQATLADIPPVILQNNIWGWHQLPYTILRHTLLRLFYDSAEEGIEWDQSTSGEIQVKIDEWILCNEKWLLNADQRQWQRGLVTLDDAEHRFITRPDRLPGFSILSLASAPRIAIQPSTAAFKRNFSRMSDKLLQNLDWSNLLVAGGIVLCSLMAGYGPDSRGPWTSSDIDIYVYGLSPEDANKKIRHVFETFCSNLPPETRTFAVRNSKTITFYAKYPLRRLQIVLKLLASPREVLLNFDLDICAMGWNGSNVWMLPRAARALETGSNVFTMNLIYGHYLSERRASQPQRVFKYASRALSPRIFPGYSLSGFAMLMRPVTLWEMGKTRELTVQDQWSNDSSYEDTPAKSPDPEYPWDERFTITGYLFHIHESNVKEVTQWVRTDPNRLRRHGVEFGYEIADLVQRVSGAPTLEILLHPQHDLCLPVLLPCDFAVYANDSDVVSQAQANTSLKERKILEPAVPGYNFLGLPGEKRRDYLCGELPRI
ncbi:hypothetical protein B0H19DRAFT_1270241 [Mycena capillaripes]|nr:hypothetical protein B0H19DRAFT_1270241 [Mycena capillaripes]